MRYFLATLALISIFQLFYQKGICNLTLKDFPLKAGGLQLKSEQFSPWGWQKRGDCLLKFERFPHRVANYDWVSK